MTEEKTMNEKEARELIADLTAAEKAALRALLLDLLQNRERAVPHVA